MKILKEGSIDNVRRLNVRIVTFDCQNCKSSFEAIESECEVDQAHFVWSLEYLAHTQVKQYACECPMSYCKEPCYSKQYTNKFMHAHVVKEEYGVDL